MSAKTDVQHFRLALKRSNTTLAEFTYLARQRPERAKEWYHGDTAIPGWVLGFAGMLIVPEAKCIAKEAADYLAGTPQMSAAE